jgi:hypothetical protein
MENGAVQIILLKQIFTYMFPGILIFVLLFNFGLIDSYFSAPNFIYLTVIFPDVPILCLNNLWWVVWRNVFPKIREIGWWMVLHESTSSSEAGEWRKVKTEREEKKEKK